MQGYIKLDQILHQLSQVIAKVNKAYLPSKPDDSHTNLAFDSMANQLTGRWFSDGERQYRIVFDLFRWEYQLLDETLTLLYRIPQDGVSFLYTEAKIQEFLTELGLDASSISNPLHFEIPQYDFLNEKLTKPNQRNLEKWIEVRELANVACHLFLGFLQKETEVRIWPHHFDTGVYVEANADVGLGFGLAMADSMVDTPYFYFAGYAMNNYQWNWDTVPELFVGDWMITDNWNGAILALDSKVPDSEQVKSFLLRAIPWYLKIQTN